MSGGWLELGSVAPPALIDARLQLHHAAQLVAAVGHRLLEPRPDDSTPNLGWSPALRALRGWDVPASNGIAAALVPSDLRLCLVSRDERISAQLDLSGQTLDAARGWLADALTDAGASLSAEGLELPGYELPAHPTSDGAAFDRAEPAAFEELARWLGNAALLLDQLAAGDPAASEVRCWPHHFDLATLVAVTRDDTGAATQTVGVGFSPGDENYAEPYWYVSPWPYPDPSALPPLGAGGRWHTEGYTAAILTASELVEGDDHESRSRAFLRDAVAASRRSLGV